MPPNEVIIHWSAQYADWSAERWCQCLIGQDIYDIRGTIRRLGHVPSPQKEFRPGLDHNPVLGIEILR